MSFMKHGSNVHLIKRMCRTHALAMSAKSESHNWSSKVWALNYVSVSYLLYPLKIITWNMGQIEDHDGPISLTWRTLRLVKTVPHNLSIFPWLKYNYVLVLKNKIYYGILYYTIELYNILDHKCGLHSKQRFSLDLVTNITKMRTWSR